MGGEDGEDAVLALKHIEEGHQECSAVQICRVVVVEKDGDGTCGEA